jgi:hypothetical protein
VTVPLGVKTGDLARMLAACVDGAGDADQVRVEISTGGELVVDAILPRSMNIRGMR